MSVEQKKFQENVKPRLSRSTRWVLRALGVLFLLAAAYAIGAAWSLARRRDALLEKRTAEATALAPEERATMDIAHALVCETAAISRFEEMSALDGKDGLAKVLAKPGLYLRVASPEVRRAAGVAEAIRRSTKDTLLYCLLTGPDAGSDYDLVVASSRAMPDSPAFDEATKGVQRLDVVQRGLGVFTAGWESEVRRANDLGLRALEYDFEQRTPEILTAAKTWAKAAYVLVVVDELPAGVGVPNETTALAASFETPILPVIRPKAHQVRFALYDLATRAPLLRARRGVDPPAFHARTAAVEAAAAEDCRIALAARQLAAP